jgi:pimeloyl-ACP methyl ester carboxylesterase
MVVPEHTVPPLSPYGTLSGQLFQYGGGRVAFESPILPFSTPQPLLSSSSASVGADFALTTPVTMKRNKCILVGGLSDGLLPLPYTQALEQVCQANDWSLVQPILSSSYTGFGHGSLDRDVQELEQLLEYLMIHRRGERFCLVGHSTGCQDAVHFLKTAADRYVNRLALVVLQAPVSDRESAMIDDTADYQEHLAMAQGLRDEGKADEMMPRKCFWAPITAQRFLDLQERGGCDDYFSSDYTNDELRERLQHVGIRARSAATTSRLRVLVAVSGMDEYVPKHVDKRQVMDRMVQAMNGGGCDDTHDDDRVATPLYIADGIHNLQQGPEASNVLIQKIDEMFKSLN